MNSKTLDSLAGWLAFICLLSAGLFTMACIMRLDVLVYVTASVVVATHLALLLIAFTLASWEREMNDLKFLMMTLLFLLTMLAATSYIDDRAGYKATSHTAVQPYKVNPENGVVEPDVRYFKHEGPGNFTGHGEIYWPDYREA